MCARKDIMSFFCIFRGSVILNDSEGKCSLDTNVVVSKANILNGTWLRPHASSVLMLGVVYNDSVKEIL